MTISYHWLSEYLPVTIEPEKLARILTGIGLEVESLTRYEEYKGGLKGLVVGEVLETTKHPNADKLTLARVNIGGTEPLRIVCGAPNVAAGQKVIVAPVGSTIYPVKGDPVQMKLARIRGEESQGMICAEDEIGLGHSHEGILILPASTQPGMKASEYFAICEDWIYEIGLTPNRMDAMSHWGVARDVCAWLSHHEKKVLRPRIPVANGFRIDDQSMPIDVKIENITSCQRYSGISITGLQIKESPAWLKNKLKAIGVRPINNIVDITNYIQHETGQPLHAFDADKIEGRKIVVKNLPEGTEFVTLDEKKRKLSAHDLMICDANKGVCIAGVFGGINSGVTENTKNIFLESAWFNPVDVRRTSFRHGLRTDAATRFEKGIDISNTVNVLKRAALLIKEFASGKISSAIVDVYPDPAPKKELVLKYHYLKKLSGKNYHPDTAKDILSSLGFEMIKEGMDELWIAAPYHKPDIHHPADVVEEILRIDGLDNIEIPQHILITPSPERNTQQYSYQEKISSYLIGCGFSEIMTNSITNGAFFNEEELKSSMRMLNSLSAELDTMRASMLHTGLQSVAYNLNRKNNDLKFFEFGKTYHTSANGRYEERRRLSLFVTGNEKEAGWKTNPVKTDIYFLKGVVKAVLKLFAVNCKWAQTEDSKLEYALRGESEGNSVIELGLVNKSILDKFDIRQPVFFADFDWDVLNQMVTKKRIIATELPKFPAVQRDLAIVLDKEKRYEELETTIHSLSIDALHDVNLFDVFESEKIGAGKKSLAVNFTFLDREKTLTDKEIDNWMTSIIQALSEKLGAVIRN